MILLPSAAPTVKAPPLMTVPTAAVVIDDVWQMLHPIWLNRLAPAMAAAVAAGAVSRGGALVARMKLANAKMSSSASSPQVPAGGLLQAVLSGVGSNPLPKPTNLPSDVFSTRLNLLVIPISFRYASEENDTRLACWFFHPNRPTRTAPLASSTGTWITWPAIRPPLCPGWALAIATIVFELIASTKPSPTVLSDVRNVRTFSPRGTRSWMLAFVARSLIN